MRRVAATTLLGLVFALGPAPLALAHPLGNFTVNQYAGLVLRPDSVRVDYVLDMAEIPAFQERATLASDVVGACGRIASGLRIVLDGRAVSLRLERSALSFPPGQGGLDTLRLECGYAAELAPAVGARHLLTIANANYAERIGWREMTARAEGVRLETALPSASVSARLTAYPQDSSAPPLDVRTAEIAFAAEPAASVPAPREAAAAERRPQPGDPVAALIAREDLALAGVALALLLALALGALHALTPGHGKTVMAAYLVATGGTRRQALLLALAVALSHTAGVLALGVVTLAGATLLAPERVYPYLSALSGALVLALGTALVVARVREAHGNAHDHGHEHAGGGALGWRSLAALGLAGGMVPSASALVLLLAAISLQRVELGLALVVAFGMGMAATLVGIGVALVGARRAAERALARVRVASRALALAPAASAILVLLLGIGMTAQALAALL